MYGTTQTPQGLSYGVADYYTFNALRLRHLSTAPEDKVLKCQHRLTPIWKRLAGGCHLDRPIGDLVRDSGFRLTHLQTGYMQGPKPMTFMYEGVASPK